jgi:ABC-type transport system involved in cytochrome bd biosynthesis fused ATPase/permease subunit
MQILFDRSPSFPADVFMDSNMSYLIADGQHPLVCADAVRDEIILYNLGVEEEVLLFAKFERITAKKIDAESKLEALSGGQKVVLMALLALFSPAPRIEFLHLSHSLDDDKATQILDMIKQSGKEILLKDLS